MEETLPLLDVDDNNLYQEIMGVLASYACIIDGTILEAINLLSTKQAKAAKSTLDAC